MKQKTKESRRDFLRKVIASGVMLGMAPYAGKWHALASSPARGTLPLRPLGKTGYQVGIYSLGAQAAIETPGKEELAEELLNRAIDLGINYIDTAAAYGRALGSMTRADAMGTSERNVGKVMKTRRKEVFLASKTHDRSYDGSMRLLETSLKNLQTDHLDLWQIHNVRGGELENLDRFFAPDGVVRAMEKARSEGMVRFLGITGHENAEVLRTLIERYPFDNILMAVNAADKFHDSFIENLLPVAVEKNMGIVGMKIPARDRIFAHGGIISMKEAMDYVLTLPVSTVVIGLDNIEELEENIRIAREFTPLTADELLAIEEKVEPYYKDLLFFRGLSDWPSDW